MGFGIFGFYDKLLKLMVCFCVLIGNFLCVVGIFEGVNGVGVVVGDEIGLLVFCV